MPTRMLRDCTDSAAVNSLSWQAEVFFYRLIMKADDFGLYYADPMLLKSYLFPRRDIRTADISRWIAECVTAGLIVSYVGADGKPYAAIRKFRQRTRAKKSSFPFPPEGDVGGHMTDTCLTHDGHVPDACPPETETNIRETINRTFGDKSPHVLPGAGAAGSPGMSSRQQPESRIYFDYAGDSRIHGISEELLKRWQENFPALDVNAELKSASAWLDANRKNRKTDVKRFLVNWLKRAQDRAPRHSSSEAPDLRHFDPRNPSTWRNYEEEKS